MSNELDRTADAEARHRADARPEGRPWWQRAALLVPAALLVLLGLAYGVDLLLAGGDIPRGTTVAGVRIGGLSQAAARERLDAEVAPELLRTRELTAGTTELAVDPASYGLSLDVDATLAAAGEQPLNPITRLVSFFGGDRDVTPVLAVDDNALAAAVAELAGSVDREPVEGGIVIDGTTARAEEPVEGQTLDQDAAADSIVAMVREDVSTLELAVELEPTVVSAEGVEQALTEFARPALAGPVGLIGPAGNRRAEIAVPAIAASLRFAPGPGGTLVGSVDEAALRAALGDTLAPFTASPADARFQLRDGAIRIVPSVDGTTADFPALTTALTEALPSPVPRDLRVPVTRAAADLTTAEAQELGVTEQISTFTTYFTNSNSGENIRVVAAEVNGAVVLPGETFSLNGYTGPRTEAQGYIESTIIQNGEFVQAVGGGVSQFATTMFNAVFFAGLEDIYHKPHSYYISRYPAGREATVFYDSIDLTWRNDGPTGIYVQTAWEPGAITVTFWGTRHFDIESVSGAGYNYTDYDVQRKPADEDCVEQSGSEGFDINVTRVFRPVGGGGVLREETFFTRYNPVPQIVCVPPERDDDPPP